MQMPAAKSYLFVPGDRPERFSKALASGAGAVILDLEDAVAPSDKRVAREAVAAWLPSAQQPVLVRINSADTAWFADDLAMCRAAGVAGIVLPKAERVEDIDTIRRQLGSEVAILPLIESAAGIWNAHALAQCRGVSRLVFGSIDFQLDLGIQGEEDELLYFRSQLVLVSRVAGIAPPVDGVTTALDDPQRLHAETLRAKRLGFGAKLCIHPKQVALVNQCFYSSPEELLWARRVLDAAAEAHGAAVAIDGKMVDKPVLARAEAILAGAPIAVPVGD